MIVALLGTRLQKTLCSRSTNLNEDVLLELSTGSAATDILEERANERFFHLHAVGMFILKSGDNKTLE